jgi:hypothetical protein
LVKLSPLSNGNARNRRNRIGMDGLRERLATACVDAQQTARFPFPGPQKRGGTLNLIMYGMRPGPPAKRLANSMVKALSFRVAGDVWRWQWLHLPSIYYAAMNAEMNAASASRAGCVSGNGRVSLESHALIAVAPVVRTVFGDF